MKKIKKLTALLLTLVMSLALAVPCFAAEPADDAVWLEVGDSYTVGGYTITIKEDTRTPAQREAERQALLQEALTRGFQIGGRYYFLKAEEYQYTSPWTYTTRCNASYGDTLHYDISNYSKEQSSEFTFSLQVGNEKPANVTVAPGRASLRRCMRRSLPASTRLLSQPLRLLEGEFGSLSPSISTGGNFSRQTMEVLL